MTPDVKAAKAARSRQYHYAHREQQLARMKARYEAHREEILARAAEYRRNNPEKVNAYNKKWYAAHPGIGTERHRKYKYGLAPEEFSDLLARQQGCCAICRVDITQWSGKRSPVHVDHSHATGQVRGLLCRDCNTALGILKDDPDRLRAAAKYIEDHLSTGRY